MLLLWIAPGITVRVVLTATDSPAAQVPVVALVEQETSSERIDDGPFERPGRTGSRIKNRARSRRCARGLRA